VGLSELRIDNGKCQVEQEECSKEYHRHEHHIDYWSVTDLHVSLDLTPALQCDTLEYSKESIVYVVKIGNAIIWVGSSFGTKVASRTSILIRVANDIIRMDPTCLNSDAPLLEHSVEHLGSSNSKNEEEEHQDSDSVLQQRKSRYDSNNQYLETFDTGNGLQGSQDSEHSQTRHFKGCSRFLWARLVDIARLFCACLKDDGKVTWHNNEEIKLIPNIQDVRVRAQDKGETNDLEAHLNSIQNQENWLEHFPNGVRVVVGGWVIDCHDKTVNYNDKQRNVIEELGVDDLEANKFDQQVAFVDCLSGSKQWESVSVDV